MVNTDELFELFRLLPHMLDHLDDSIYIMKVKQSEFTYAYLNASASRFSGVTMNDLNKTFAETHSLEMANYLHNKYARVLAERKSIRFEDGVLMPNGLFSGESILSPIFDIYGEISYILCITRDTTDRKRNEELLLHYAYHDELTQLYNRRYMSEHVVCPAAIYLLDLDHFKNINDTFGHDVGDRLLVEVAARLNLHFGSTYRLIRLGGDEFIIVSYMDTSSHEQVAGTIIGTFTDPFIVNEMYLKAGVSIGVAINSNRDDTRTLLKQADIALYRAKGEGRRRFHIYTPTSTYDHIVKFSHELALSKALERGELQLLYQPIYNPFIKEIIGVEALLRWNSEELGLISPSDFIPVAEETGLIIPIGEWVIRQACRDWHQLNGRYGADFKISVNISRVQLNEPSFVEKINRILEEESVSPCVIDLEITESMVIHHINKVRLILERLRSDGYTITLDDFGTGYSSLSMLTALPIDKLKIDRAFIQDMNQTLVSAMIVMAKALNLQVVAEGVEDLEQFHKLKEMACSCIQGYLICKPVELKQLPQKCNY